MHNITIGLKQKIIGQMLAKLEQSLDATKRELAHQTETRNESEGAMISRYDTFKEQAEYTANALTRNVSVQSTDIHNLRVILDNGLEPGDRAKLGSVVVVEVRETVEYYFLLPAVSSDEWYPDELGGTELIPVTPASPIGKLLVGKTRGDTFAFRERTFTIHHIF